MEGPSPVRREPTAYLEGLKATELHALTPPEIEVLRRWGLTLRREVQIAVGIYLGLLSALLWNYHRLEGPVIASLLMLAVLAGLLLAGFWTTAARLMGNKGDVRRYVFAPYRKAPRTEVIMPARLRIIVDGGRPLLPTRADVLVVAPLPEGAIRLYRSLEETGSPMAIRECSEPEKEELARHADRESLVPSLILTAVLCVATGPCFIVVLVGAVWLLVPKERRRARAAAALANPRITVTLAPMGPAGETFIWAEYLHATGQAWSVNGHPAEWRLG